MSSLALTPAVMQSFCVLQSLTSDHTGVTAVGVIGEEFAYDIAYLTKDKANPVHLLNQGWVYLGKGYIAKSVRISDGAEFPLSNPEAGNECYFWRKTH